MRRYAPRPTCAAFLAGGLCVAASLMEASPEAVRSDLRAAVRMLVASASVATYGAVSISTQRRRGGTKRNNQRREAPLVLEARRCNGQLVATKKCVVPASKVATLVYALRAHASL